MKTDFVSRSAITLMVAIVISVNSKDSNAAKPTYKCEKLENSIEEMICKDNKLAELDQKVQSEYEHALLTLPKSELKTLKAVQRGWIKGRNDCWKAEDKPKCILDNYNIRITELQIQAGSIMVPKASVFECGNKQILTAYFYNNTQLPTAVLNFGDERINAYQAVSASGVKYDGRNVGIWNKGDEATLTWYDKEFNCKEIPSSNL